jgi:putative membrane protein
VLAAGTVVAVQIPYPLLPTGGAGRLWLTVGQIVAFFVASVSHAALRRGWSFTSGYLAITLVVGFTAEAVGIRTGWPFGRYSYTDRLGPEIAGVPALIVLGWAMMTYPALLAARRLTARWRTDRRLTAAAASPRHHRGGDVAVMPAEGASTGGLGRAVVTAVAGGVLLAGWDLFLDPRMAAEGFWTWPPGGWPALNGIPLSNAVGWLAVGALLVALVDRLPDPTRAQAAAHAETDARPPAAAGNDDSRPDGSGGTDGDGVLLALLGWTYGSWVFAYLAFFRQPWVALAGGVGMGLPLLALAVPAAAVLRRRRASRPAS